MGESEVHDELEILLHKDRMSKTLEITLELLGLTQLRRSGQV